MEGGLFPMRDTARRVSALRRLNGAVEQMQWDGQINSREAEGFRRYIQYLRSFSPEPVTPPIRLSLSEPARVVFPVESGRPTGPILCESAREMDEIQVLGDDRVQQKFEEERVDASGQTDPHNESAGDFPANEVVQTYKTQYPSGSAFIFILIGLCLSVFCLALVRNPPSNCKFWMTRLSSDLNVGQNNRRNGYTQNYRPIQGTRRCGLVRERLPPHDLCIPAHFRQTLHILSYKISLSLRVDSVRNRVADLRYHTNIDWSYCGQSSGRNRICGAFFRFFRYYLAHCTTRAATNVYWFNRGNVWDRQRCRTYVSFFPQVS